MQMVHLADALAKVPASVAKIAIARDRDELMRSVQDAIELLGFASYSYIATVPIEDRGSFAPLMTTVPAGMWEAFEGLGLNRSNPFLEHMRTTGQGVVFPFAGVESQPFAARVLAFLHDYGFVGSAITPVVSTTEQITLMGAYSRHAIPTREVLAPLAVVGSAISLRILALIDGADQPSPLSSVQRDILGWIRQGKSNLDTATILGISKRKCDYHVAEIYRKLGVYSRVEAVAAGERLLADPILNPSSAPR